MIRYTGSEPGCADAAAWLIAVAGAPKSSGLEKIRAKRSSCVPPSRRGGQGSLPMSHRRPRHFTRVTRKTPLITARSLRCQVGFPKLLFRWGELGDSVEKGHGRRQEAKRP